MAFDKRAYNREYYRRHKDLWQKYREGDYPSSGTVTYTTARPEYKPGYGAANSANRSRSYQSSVRNRSHAIQSSNEAIERRKQQEAAQNRYGKISRNMEGREYLKDMRRSIDWWNSDKNNPALKYDRKKDRYVGKSGLGKKTIADRVKGAGKTYADYWKTGAKSIKSGITGSAKSYSSAWKTGAKTISKSAEKAKKKAAKFIARLFG